MRACSTRRLAGAAGPQRVVIQVAETLGSREQFTRALVAQALARDLLLVLVAGTLLLLAVAWALRPLARLRDEVSSRSPQDLTPIAAAAAGRRAAAGRGHQPARGAQPPADRSPAPFRRRRLAPAAHAARRRWRPSSAIALREDDPAHLRDVLAAFERSSTKRCARPTRCWRWRAPTPPNCALEPVDLACAGRGGDAHWWSEARERGIDLGLDAAEGVAQRVRRMPGC